MSAKRVVQYVAAALCGTFACIQAQAACTWAVISVDITANSVALESGCGWTQLESWGGGIVHVHRAHSNTSGDRSLAVVGPASPGRPDVEQTGNDVIITWSRLRARVERSTGRIRFEDTDGHIYLAESPEPSWMEASASDDKGLFLATQRFAPTDSEAFYGLGQRQAGRLNLRGSFVRLQQANAQIALPLLISSKGYGLLWDNASVTDIDVASPAANGRLIFSAEAARDISYYFIDGGTTDEVIAGYRRLTGAAPMMPRWVFGYWQSKERYKTQQEVLEVAERYRAMQVPLDVVVQDWQYWRQGDWGSHRFDPARYPDPAAMVAALHDMHVHAVISVWPRFDAATGTGAALDRGTGLFPRSYTQVYLGGEGRWYDAFGPGGLLYWRQIFERLGTLGFDGWWLDADEPELAGKWGEMRSVATAAGPGALVYNAYPLAHTTNVFNGMRIDLPDKRPVILSRSAWAGQQRNNAICWSGDTQGDWETFRRQIVAGLSFVISGIPYWNSDIGGFFGGDPKDPAYRELFLRWFQYGSFAPVFRVHGTNHAREVWQFDPEAQRILKRYIELRYRLMPYWYSLAWAVTERNSTMMRPLVMDFGEDRSALDIEDQFMIGPSLMVAPQVRPGALLRSVYLPGDNSWYDFWTGRRFAGRTTIATDTPLETIPLYVRAGTILPIGPTLQFADEQSAAPIELRIYPGADAHLQLYNDAGDGWGYTRGEYAVTNIHWNDLAGTLQFSPREGTFPGMNLKQDFAITLVGKDTVARAPQIVHYDGRSVSVHPD